VKDRATAVKDQLVACNMRLVVSIAKRHSGQIDNFFELLSGWQYVVILRAWRNSILSRGNKFSTYASWAIMRISPAVSRKRERRQERYVTGKEELFDIAPDTRTDENEVVSSAEQDASRVIGS